MDLNSKSRIERKMERTRKHIVTTAVNLFKENGVEETTMEQIAEEADVARGTLYNYFSSKEAIINDYIEQSFKDKKSIRFQELREMPDTRARMTFIFTQLISGIHQQKELFEKHLIFRMQNMLSFQQIEGDKNNFSLLGYKIIELGQKNGEIRCDIPFYILADLYDFCFVEAVKPLYMEPDNYNMSESIDRSTELFINAVRTE